MEINVLRLIFVVVNIPEFQNFYCRQIFKVDKNICLYISGVLVDFISIPVTVGFTSATSVIIAVSQLKSLLGLKISTAGFLDTLFKVFQNLHETRLADCLLGLGCIAILLFLRVCILKIQTKLVLYKSI